MHKITGRALPTVTAVQTEAARVEAMIAAATQRIESSDASLRSALHLQVCRAELHAYLAGLMYSLGYTDLLDKQSVGFEYLPEIQIGSVEDTFKQESEEDTPRFVECFEC